MHEFRHIGNLQVDTLADMTPIFNGCDVIRLAARHLLWSHVKSQRCVRDAFFPDHEPIEAERLIDPSLFDFDTYACLVVSLAVSRSEDAFGISRMLGRGNIDSALEDIYRSPQWRRMGKTCRKLSSGITARPYTQMTFRSLAGYIRNVITCDVSAGKPNNWSALSTMLTPSESLYSNRNHRNTHVFKMACLS